MNFMIEELKKPERNLPIISIASVIIITILYNLLNMSYIVGIGSNAVANNVAVASVSKNLGNFKNIVIVLHIIVKKKNLK